MFNFNGKTNVNIIVNSRLKIHNYNNPSVHNFRLRRRRLVAIKLEQITRPLIVCEITMIFTWKLGTSSKYNWWCRSLRRLMTPKLALYWSRTINKLNIRAQSIDSIMKCLQHSIILNNKFENNVKYIKEVLANKMFMIFDSLLHLWNKDEKL